MKTNLEALLLLLQTKFLITKTGRTRGVAAAAETEVAAVACVAADAAPGSSTDCTRTPCRGRGPPSGRGWG